MSIDAIIAFFKPLVALHLSLMSCMMLPIVCSQPMYNRASLKSSANSGSVDEHATLGRRAPPKRAEEKDNNSTPSIRREARPREPRSACGHGDEKMDEAADGVEEERGDACGDGCGDDRADEPGNDDGLTLLNSDSSTPYFACAVTNVMACSFITRLNGDNNDPSIGLAANSMNRASIAMGPIDNENVSS